jgi:REP element-mobilizing transposase RayT
MVVAGYHLIWTAYGHWLPNDPRGSTSTEVRSVELQDLGELHFGRKRLQPARRVVKAFYEEAKQRLKHELLTLDHREVTAVAEAFAGMINKQRYTCYACAIMPDHVHLLIRKHRHPAEEMIELMQDASCLAVRDCGLRAPDHPVWTEGGWKGFLTTPEDFRRIIRYIELNPVKIGRKRQDWKFVTPYDGWIPGQVFRAKPQAEGPIDRK